MKQLILSLLLHPALLFAQQKHRFENDTLYTSCGYKIYPGQVLHFGSASDWVGFRFIKLKGGYKASVLENNSVVVKSLSRYGYSPTGSASIDVKGSAVFKDGSKGTLAFSLAFDLAIGRRLPGLPAELIVPEEFRLSVEEAQAQKMPALWNDTLYTSCGYKIYKGQVLQFGKNMANQQNFRYINVRSNITHRSVINQQLRVKEIRDFSFSVLNNSYITIVGTLIRNNIDKEDIELHISFDYAIEDIPGLPSEIVVPDEYRNRLKRDPQLEVKKVQMFYEDRVISKEEMERVKKKMLGQ